MSGGHWDVIHTGGDWSNGDGRETVDQDYDHFADDVDSTYSSSAAGQPQIVEPPRRERHRDGDGDHRARRPRGDAEPTLQRQSTNRSGYDGGRGGEGQYRRSDRERSYAEPHRGDRAYPQEANRGREDGSRGGDGRRHRSDRDSHRRPAEQHNRARDEPPRRPPRSDSRNDFEASAPPAGHRRERRGQDGGHADWDEYYDVSSTQPPSAGFINPAANQMYGTEPERHTYAEDPLWAHPQAGDAHAAAVSSTGLAPVPLSGSYGPYGSYNSYDSYPSGQQQDISSEDVIRQRLETMSLSSRGQSASTVGAESTWSPVPYSYDQSTTSYPTSPPTSPASSRSQPVAPSSQQQQQQQQQEQQQYHHRRRRRDSAQAHDAYGYDAAPVRDGRGFDHSVQAPAGRGYDEAQGYSDRQYVSVREYDYYQPPPPHVPQGASASTRHRKRSSVSEESLMSSPRASAGPGSFPREGSSPPPPPARRQSTWDATVSRREVTPTPGDSNISQHGSSYDVRGSPQKKSSRGRAREKEEASKKDSKKRRNEVDDYVDDQRNAHKYKHRQQPHDYDRHS